MHELSIALRILDIIGEESARLGAAPCAVHLRVGPLAGIVKEALRSAFQLASEGTEWDGMELIVEEAPLVGWCNSCDGERPVSSLQDFSCAECGETIARIVSGQELELTALEMRDERAPDDATC